MSKLTTQGSRECTTGVYLASEGAETARLNMAARLPGVAAGRSASERRQRGDVSIAHHLHAQRHSRYMRSGSARHCPAVASAAQRFGASSWHCWLWHRWHVTGHCVFM